MGKVSHNWSGDARENAFWRGLSGKTRSGESGVFTRVFIGMRGGRQPKPKRVVDDPAWDGMLEGPMFLPWRGE